MKILYLGWIGAKNIGDDLMLENFKIIAKKRYGEDCIVDSLFPSEDFNNFDKYDLVCLGGGSILLEGFIEILYKALKKGKRVMVWGSGYDELLGDKFIGRIENSYISPYIYSDLTEVKLNEIAKNADFFGVRGPLTYTILEKSNIDMANVKICGDPGFITEKKSLSNLGTNLNFTKEDKVVAVNMGSSYNKIYGQREDIVLEALIRACDKILKRGYKIYLYSLWSVDLDFALKIYKRLEAPNDVILDLSIHSGSEIASIMSNCIFSINFKLHGNVLSASSLIPFICLGYRLKAFDFVKSIDCEELNISTDKENLEDEIISKVEYIENNYEIIIDKIDKNIKVYKDIIGNPFK